MRGSAEYRTIAVGGPYAVTVDDFEAQFATNHLGHFLFTNLIRPHLLASSAPRVVNVSSNGHRLSDIRYDDVGFSGGKTYDMWKAYGQSKTANMLFAVGLTQRGIPAFSLHPGGAPRHSASLGFLLTFARP